jgi:hypothetical protein
MRTLRNDILVIRGLSDCLEVGTGSVSSEEAFDEKVLRTRHPMIQKKGTEPLGDNTHHNRDTYKQTPNNETQELVFVFEANMLH